MNYSRILITGGNGQLANQWKNSLSASGSKVWAPGKSEFDLTDEKSIKRGINDFGPEILINCAAYTKVDLAEEERELGMLVNGRGVKLLAEACKSIGCFVVHYSTDYVFGGYKEDANKYPAGYPVNASADPVNYYGLTKWEGEKSLQESGAEFLLIRVAWLCSAHGNNFLKTMLRLAQDRDSLSVVNDQVGSPSFANDVVTATQKLLEAKQTGIFHVGCKGKYSWYDFAKRIFELSETEIEIKPITSDQFPMKAARPFYSKLDLNSYTSLFPNEELSIDKGILLILEELRAKNSV
ncbi:MAG: dTDP-4-dehydrorhamnose reductase [Balneolales bacterium]|nr:dTDP-4-dehydrorhamnose reductase [Balneolales bacterium]